MKYIINTLSPERFFRYLSQAQLFFYDFLRLSWICSCIFRVWPMITYIYVIRPSSLGFTQQTVSCINTWSLFQRIYTLFSLRFENVTCRTKNVYIYVGLKTHASFLIYSIILYLLSPQPMKTQQHIINWFVLKKRGPLHKLCDIFFIYFMSFDVW